MREPSAPLPLHRPSRSHAGVLCAPAAGAERHDADLLDAARRRAHDERAAAVALARVAAAAGRAWRFVFCVCVFGGRGVR